MKPVLPPRTPTPVITARVAMCVRRLVPIGYAGVLAGLPVGLAESWMERGKRGRPGDRQFAIFYRAVTAEIRRTETMLREAADAITYIYAAAKAGNAQAAAWLEKFINLHVVGTDVRHRAARSSRAERPGRWARKRVRGKRRK